MLALKPEVLVSGPAIIFGNKEITLRLTRFRDANMRVDTLHRLPGRARPLNAAGRTSER